MGCGFTLPKATAPVQSDAGLSALRCIGLNNVTLPSLRLVCHFRAEFPRRENDAGSLSKETEQLDGEKWPDVLFEDGLVTGECGRL